MCLRHAEQEKCQDTDWVFKEKVKIVQNLKSQRRLATGQNGDKEKNNTRKTSQCWKPI